MSGRHRKASFVYVCVRILALPWPPPTPCPNQPANPRGLVYDLQVLEEQLGRRGEAVAPLRPTLVRALADVQERVTFRAHTFIMVGIRWREDGTTAPD